ncbi:MAG: RidA family protein [Candidatus Thorarchaeota archaeon]|jgi:2-iminobutanoate/2-iminopropanoate deaminase
MNAEFVDLHTDLGYSFSTYVRAGDFIFTSHHGATVDENGEPLDTIEGQTEYTIRQLKETLESAGASLSEVIKTTVFLKNIEDFGKMRDVYKECFNAPYPARSAITTDFVHSKVLIQVEAVAYRPKQ